MIHEPTVRHPRLVTKSATGAQATVQAVAAVAAIQGVSTTEFTSVIVSWMKGWMIYLTDTHYVQYIYIYIIYRDQ